MARTFHYSVGRITIEYVWEDGAAMITDAWAEPSGSKIELSDADRERLEIKIGEERYYDDHNPEY